MPALFTILGSIVRHSALLVVLTVTPATAEIFMRLGHGAHALEQLGGVALYHSAMRINGQPGQLAVYGFDTPTGRLVPDLRKVLNMPDLHTAAASTLATSIRNGQVTTLLLLPGHGTPNSLAILMEQSETAHRAARGAPSDWPEQLAYPQATLLFTAENEKTRTTLAVATTRDTPDTAAARMDTILQRQGWTRMPPLPVLPGLTLYGQGNRVCAFSALAPETPDGQTRITVLQRLGTTP